MKNRLCCGASRKCITPPADLLPNLYGLMRQSFGGVLDDIFVRVMLLKNSETALMFVSFDLDKAPYPQKWMEVLSERFDIPEDKICYSAIHTHTAPVTDARPFEGPNRKCVKSAEQQEATNRYEEYIFGKLMEAAEEAVSSAKPAKYGYACTDSYININRNYDYVAEDGGVDCETGNNGAGDVDHTLFLAKFEAEDGTPIAMLMNYAVHNCILHTNTIYDGKLAISSDMGGNVAQKLETHNPGVVALWTSGAAGDVNPILMNAVYYPSTEDGSFVTENLSGDQTLFLRAMVSRHYADVLTALKKIRCDREKAVLDSRVHWVCTPGRHMPGQETSDADKVPDYRIRMQGLRIDDLVICGVSGELYTSFARKLQAISPFDRTLIINHNACLMANAQYILDDDGIARNALGYNHSFIRPGFVADALTESAAKLFAQLKEKTNET